MNELGIEKNTKKFSTSKGKVIPDSITPSSVIEIKDVKKVFNTKQIKGEKEVAKFQKKEFKIVTGKNTYVSKNAKKDSRVERRDDLGK